jgi:hypothetical protein
MIGETVTLIRRTRTGTDADGNDVWTDTPVVVPRCAVWPRTAVETLAGGRQDTSIVGLSLLAPPGTVIAVTDRITARGLTWEVDGEPGVWDSALTGSRAGVEVALRRVSG